jgi:hypothetical protein
VASTRHVTIPSEKDDALPHEDTARGLLVGVEMRRTANLRRDHPRVPGEQPP